MKTSPIEKKLVKECINGNRDAQNQLYHQYSKAMYHVCSRLMQKQEDAEDALQDAFVDIFRKMHTFRFESTIGAWIKRIVVNTCLNLLKKQKDFIDDLSNLPDIPSEESNVDISEQYLQVKRIKQAILDLPDGYRIICSLYLFDGYDHKEIADFLNISVSTSKSQLHRGKQKIKKQLIAHG